MPSEDAPIVLMIFNEFLSGKKQFEIVENLSQSGINITKQHLNVIPHPKCTTFNKFSAAPLYH
jgi:hypothetical protein